MHPIQHLIDLSDIELYQTDVIIIAEHHYNEK